jgi:Fe-S-cluster-containing hydrogenase component 2
MQSSHERVYVAGDLGGIAEASTAMEEGRIAGIAAASSLGLPTGESSLGEARERLALLSREVPTTFPRQPPPRQRRRSPLGVIECDQPIPCNPCEAACRQGAIRIGPDPMRPPVVDPDRCTGCLRCLRECPGMAIFVVDEGAGDGEATVAMPWEFLPLPKVGERGQGLDRSGRRVCPARVVNVRPFRRRGDTAIVTVAVPMQHARRARGFRGRSSG